MFYNNAQTVFMVKVWINSTLYILGLPISKPISEIINRT